MDSLTQIVLGASVGEAVLGKKIGNKAMLWGAIAGTIPDLDVLLNFITDEMTANLYHRGFSHSLVFCIALAPILGWLVHKMYRKKEATFKNWTWMFFMCLVTHPLLDAHTAWGTQFFWPLEERLAYKNIFVIDPLYTVPFFLLVLLAMFYKRTNPKRRALNRWALLISTFYMLLTLVFKSIGYIKFKDALHQQNIDYVELETTPTPLNSILWNAYIETDQGYISGYYSLFDSSKISFSSEIPKNHNLLAPYSNQKVVQQMLKISDGWYFIEKTDQGLFYNDMRFGQRGFTEEAPYVWQYLLVEQTDGELKVQRPNSPSTKTDFSSLFAALFDRIKGN